MKGSSYRDVMTRHPHPQATADLAYYIDRDGVDAHHQELQSLGSDALALGVRPGAAGVLIDPASPAVARERAFAIVARGLDRHARTTPTFVVVA